MSEFPSLTIFLIVGGVGFLYLMISLIVEHLFDWLQIDLELDTKGDFRLFDSRVVSVFLTALGFVGSLAIQFGFGALVAAHEARRLSRSRLIKKPCVFA